MSGFFNGEFKVILRTERYDEAVRFYRDMLGLLVNYTWNVSCPSDHGVRFYTGPVSRLEVIETPGAHGTTAYAVNTDRYEECLARLEKIKQTGVFAEIAPCEGRTNASRVTDVLGNTIYLWKADEPVAPPYSTKKDKSLFGDKLCQILSVRDLEQSVAFYRRVLQENEQYLDPNTAIFKAGSGWICLKYSSNISANPAMMCLEADNVNACYRYVQNENIAVEEQLHDIWYGMRLFRLKDPDGHVLEIFSYSKKIRDIEP